MVLLRDVLQQHRDVSKETLQSLLLGVDSSLDLRVIRLDDSGNLIFSTDPITPPKIVVGASFDLLPAADQDLLTYVCPAGKKATVLCAVGFATGLGLFRIELEGSWVWEKGNSYAEQGVEFSQRLVVAEGETLKLAVTNKSFLQNLNSYRGFLYLREDPV